MDARPSVTDEKRALRSRCAEALRALSSENLRREGSLAVGAVTGSPTWEQARTVFVFLSTENEITSDGLVEASLRAGKKVALPRVEGGELSFREIASLEGPWEVGSFGIREPPSRIPAVDLSSLPGPLLVIAPGLAFDAEGRRLGHGKGYYDRFIRGLRERRSDVYVVALCATVQLVARVPMDDRDERVDAVCSGGSLIAVQA